MTQGSRPRYASKLTFLESYVDLLIRSIDEEDPVSSSSLGSPSRVRIYMLRFDLNVTKE